MPLLLQKIWLAVCTENCVRNRRVFRCKQTVLDYGPMGHENSVRSDPGSDVTKDYLHTGLRDDSDWLRSTHSCDWNS